MEFVVVLAVLAIVVILVVGPLRAGRHGGSPETGSAERDELEAAREAKFREIREAELDYRTGKLSRQDWRLLDSTLRAEAIEVLRRLDALDDRENGSETKW